MLQEVLTTHEMMTMATYCTPTTQVTGRRILNPGASMPASSRSSSYFSRCFSFMRSVWPSSLPSRKSNSGPSSTCQLLIAIRT